MSHSFPKVAAVFGESAGLGGDWLFWVASGFESFFDIIFLGWRFVNIVASGSIGAASFEWEVDAKFGFIVLFDMYFFSDFWIWVCEGALDSECCYAVAERAISFF